jgi:hypothetical protein
MDGIHITFTVNVIILMIVVAFMLIYLLSIILVRRFHTATNILTGNVCITGIICSSYWIVYTVLSGFYVTILIQSTISCILTAYLSVMVNYLTIHALTMITVNRFFTVMYPNKRLFKKRAWSLISSVVQWIVAIILSLPHLALSFQVNVI